MGSSEPEGVVDGSVDGFGVVAASEQFGEAGVVGCDDSDVFGAVEIAGGVVVVDVEADRDGRCAEVVGEPVVVEWLQLNPDIDGSVGECPQPSRQLTERPSFICGFRRILRGKRRA